MTSEQRKEARFQRRKAARLSKKRELYGQCDDFEKVFSYEHLYSAFRKCTRGVKWKASVQRYILHASENLWKTHRQLMAGKYRTKGFFEFDIYERGKHRHIRSVTVDERVVQRCLCDYALVPMITRSFVYDNGASLEGKGYTFTVNRLCTNLRKHYRKYGTNGYILLYDFSRFFDRVSHQLIRRILHSQFTDERIIRLTEHFVDAFGPVGMGLGSQISQVLALASANGLDHTVAEICRIRQSARYMDDGYLIHHSKEKLRECMDAIKRVCKELDIVLNEKKTQIVKLSRGFTYLKIRFFLLPSGKIVRKIYRRSVIKQRRKLKSFALKVAAGKMTFSDVYASYKSWRAYASNFNAFHTVSNMRRLFIRLFVQKQEDRKCFLRSR